MVAHEVNIMKFVYDAITTAVAPIPVFQSVPDGREMPYVEINSIQSLYNDIVTDRRFRHIVRVHVWSNYRGQLEVLNIMDKIDAALHHKRFDFSGGRINQTVIQSKNAIRDIDNITFSGSINIDIDSEVI